MSNPDVGNVREVDLIWFTGETRVGGVSCSFPTSGSEFAVAANIQLKNQAHLSRLTASPDSAAVAGVSPGG